MLRLLASFLGLLAIAPQSQAATWYAFMKDYTDSALYFFDLDTVAKQGDTVVVWVKYVNDRSTPDNDGSYATAMKYNFLCGKRTLQALVTVTYDKTGKFIRTYPEPARVQDAVPGSLGEGVLKTVCTPDFPRNKSGDLYSPVVGNDIFEYTTNYFDYLRAKNTDPAPK